MPGARFEAATAMLALVVIALGAFVRLSDAGLACPDWPGCYGRALAPTSAAEVATANADFPDTPVESAKAWKEMAHRYLAAILGLSVAALAFRLWRGRGEHPRRAAVGLAVLALVIFQALLGMWTVTLLLEPVVVTAHLLGGVTTAALLWWLYLERAELSPTGTAGLGALRPWIALGIAILYLQLSLGGWTSANYAALACPDFPTCQGQWWPEMDFGEGFGLATGRVADGEPRLSLEGLVSIQVAHRLGAVFTSAYLLGLALLAVALGAHGAMRRTVAITVALLLTQLAVGVGNVLMVRPLPLAVAHNAVAALLLLSLITQYHLAARREARPRPRDASLGACL